MLKVEYEDMEEMGINKKQIGRMEGLFDEIANEASPTGRRILGNIRETMSDRVATEMKWHELLQLHRKEVLPYVNRGS